MDSLLEHGLVAIFFALILTSVGLPIPEDISLLCAGALVGLGHASLPHALIVGYLGVLTGDLIAYTMGRRIGTEPSGLLAKLIGPSDLAWIARFYERWGAGAIVLARQVPGMRLPGFFFAGASGVRLVKFIAFDAAAALVTVGVYVSLGRAFSGDLGRLLDRLDQLRVLGMTCVGALITILIWRRVRRRIWQRKLAASEARDAQADKPGSSE